LTSQLYQDHILQDRKPVQINKLCFLFLTANTTISCVYALPSNKQRMLSFSANF